MQCTYWQYQDICDHYLRLAEVLRSCGYGAMADALKSDYDVFLQAKSEAAKETYGSLKQG